MARGQILPIFTRPDRYGVNNRFRIVGTIDEMGTPGAYQVRLYNRRTGRLITETRSAPDGTWEIRGYPPSADGYFITGHDHTDPLRNADISDYITPEPMPT